MQHARIRSRRDDGLVGEFPATADELVRKLRLDLRLGHAGLRELQHPAESLVSQCAGFADHLDFVRRFDDAQAVEQGSEPQIAMQRKARLRLADEAGVARLDIHARTAVFVGIQIRARAFAHHLPEEIGELVDPAHFLDARAFLRLLFRELVSFPNCDEVARFSDKKNLAMFLVCGVGEKQQDRLLLIHAGEVEEIGVLNEADRPVSVCRENVVRIDDGERAFLHDRLQSGAIFGEKSGVDGCVAHGWVESAPCYAIRRAQCERSLRRSRLCARVFFPHQPDTQYPLAVDCVLSSSPPYFTVPSCSGFSRPRPPSSGAARPLSMSVPSVSVKKWPGLIAGEK